MTLVGGDKPGIVMRDERVSEPGAAKGTWPDDPDADWPTDDEIRQHLLEEITELVEGRDPRCMSVDEVQDAIKNRFPGLEAKEAEAEAWAAVDLDEDSLPDPDADIAAGRYTAYESSEEFLASFFLISPKMLLDAGVASKLTPHS